jgi:immune inhibitor A
VTAIPPHPDLLQANRAAGTSTASITQFPDPQELHARGIDTPDDYFTKYLATRARTSSTAPAATGFKVLALLVDFSDKTGQVAPEFYDTLIFGEGPGSVSHYISEISYGQVELTTLDLPSSLGWIRAPQTYSYYVNGNYGMGARPQNAQQMILDLAAAVDGLVDFSEYDNDGDGYVDVLIVVHAGTGAEMSGNLNDIWSHKWSVPETTKDGVKVFAYTTQPEYWQSAGDMTIGVYAHELCHGFGLPDLYDTDYSSRGIGYWGLMSHGAWNGTLGDSPAHPCAWSRIRMGFADAVEVADFLPGQTIAPVQQGGTIYRITAPGTYGREYFLIENRQQLGYDAGLPGAGLLIWHIEEGKSNNNQEWHPGKSNSAHYLVALEQADGLYDMERDVNNGDAADPFPGATGNTAFTPTSTPPSNTYEHGPTTIAVTNITVNGSTITVDLGPDSSLALSTSDGDPANVPASFILAQNYPNPFNPETTIEFSVDRSCDVDLAVYNVCGQLVTTLFDGSVGVGTSAMTWDGSDGHGNTVASGVYFYRLTIDGNAQTRKMLLIR